MKPEIDFALRVVAGKLVSEVAPLLEDPYVRSNVEVMAGLLTVAAEDYERAAALRVEENRGMRAIFREAAGSMPDADLRARLESAASEGDPGLRISDLNAANERLRRLLIELHAFVETRDEEWAVRTSRAVWRELRASAERRALSFFPL